MEKDPLLKRIERPKRLGLRQPVVLAAMDEHLRSGPLIDVVGWTEFRGELLALLFPGPAFTISLRAAMKRL
jgi:hypothetical protein